VELEDKPIELDQCIPEREESVRKYGVRRSPLSIAQRVDGRLKLLKD
jgi:hypothetical protein